MIEIKNISKSFAEKEIIKNLSLSLSKNLTYCIMGPSGIGKTTLWNILSGLLKPDSGTISGADEKKSFVFQENRLIPWLNLLDNILYVNPDTAAAKKALSATSLSDDWDKLPEELSGGMARRGAIARAAAYGGEIFFIDEPMHGLDVKTSEEILSLLKSVTQGKTAFVITHSPEEAFYLADKIIFLKQHPVTFAEIIDKSDFSSADEIRNFLLN